MPCRLCEYKVTIDLHARKFWSDLLFTFLLVFLQANVEIGAFADSGGRGDAMGGQL